MKGCEARMRKRTISFVLRLSETEHARLMKDVRRTGLSREAFLRALISGYAPKPLPPLDYHAMIRELRAIGNNLNQLAAKAHATGHLDHASFQNEASDLRRTVMQIREAVTAPEPRSDLLKPPQVLSP